MKKILLLTFLAISIASCNNPLDKEYNRATITEDAKAIKNSGKLNDEEIEILGTSIASAEFQGKDLSGQTFKEILDDGKKAKAEKEELAEKARAEAEAKAAKLANAVTIAIYDKGYLKYDYEEALSYNYVIKNKSSKEISAIKFHFNIKNALGDDIGNGYSVSLTDKEILPNSEYKDVVYFNFNSFINDDVVIKNSKFEGLDIIVNVDKIVYSDGTSLE